MKAIFFYIMSFVFLPFSFGQKQGKITYEIKIGNNPKDIKLLDMWFTDEKYLSELRYDDPSKSPLLKQLKNMPNFDSAELVNKIKHQQSTFAHPNLYGTIKNNIRTSTLLLLSKKVCVIDTIDIVEWTLLNDTLTINSIFCQKAICKINNSDCIAWFAPSIPVSLAPQVYRGLPGLLIKLYNSSTQTLISMVNIEWPTKSPIRIEPCSGSKTMSKAQFQQIEKETMTQLRKMFEESKNMSISDLMDKAFH